MRAASTFPGVAPPDVAVVIPLEEEYAYVAEVLPPLRTERGKHQNSYILREPESGREVRACVVSEMGLTNAAIAVERLIEQWDPAVVVVLGIAGGLDASLQLIWLDQCQAISAMCCRRLGRCRCARRQPVDRPVAERAAHLRTQAAPRWAHARAVGVVYRRRADGAPGRVALRRR